MSYTLFDDNGLRKTTVLTASAILNFPSIAANGSTDLSITCTGAAVGDIIAVGPPAALNSGLIVTGFVVTANTVAVRVHNSTGGAIDLAPAIFSVAVIKP